ncbi:ephrin-A1-like [Pristis pectinata]|uniref:ephrin-A1-like n=1 Tax=Pristis pectinata TaxID=685728 RepID=UPI00223CE630|nr:ephrin-A1-like [Pristis pectinata]
MTWKVLFFVLFGVYRSVAERYTVYWNRSNPALLGGDFTLEVKLNDYLDILCPHYEGPSPPQSVEEYTLYLVGEEDFRQCRVGSKDQVRWECRKPHAPHGPERFSEKFQRFTPFSLGKEFQEGRHYHYISKAVHRRREPCLKLRVLILRSKARENHVEHYTTKAKLPADQPPEEMPDTQRSTGGSAAPWASPGLALLLQLLTLAML